MDDQKASGVGEAPKPEQIPKNPEPTVGEENPDIANLEQDLKAIIKEAQESGQPDPFGLGKQASGVPTVQPQPGQGVVAEEKERPVMKTEVVGSSENPTIEEAAVKEEPVTAPTVEPAPKVETTPIKPVSVKSEPVAVSGEVSKPEVPESVSESKEEVKIEEEVKTGDKLLVNADKVAENAKSELVTKTPNVAEKVTGEKKPIENLSVKEDEMDKQLKELGVLTAEGKPAIPDEKVTAPPNEAYRTTEVIKPVVEKKSPATFVVIVAGLLGFILLVLVVLFFLARSGVNIPIISQYVQPAIKEGDKHNLLPIQVPEVDKGINTATQSATPSATESQKVSSGSATPSGFLNLLESSKSASPKP